ncbi:MAG: oligosaccharide flippase family protein, partial [Oscillospiraceae bacterium]
MSDHTVKKQTAIHHTFLQGALILTIGMVIVKVVGALFKLPLANIITANGMGYFTAAYSFYAVFFSLATAGFPIAIAKMVAENYSLGRYNDVKQVKRVSLPIFLITGSLGTLVMMVGAPFYANSLNNPGMLLPILVLAPSIFFCCLSSIYRGYYEGLRNMYPTAISEIVEVLVKLIVGLSGAILTMYLCHAEFEATGTVFGVAMDVNVAMLSTYSYAASAAILGVTAGSLLSWMYLVLYYRRKGDGITTEMYRSSPMPHSGKSVAKKLVMIAIPIGIGSLAISVAGLVDVTFLLGRLGDTMKTNPEVVLNMYRGLIPPENLADITTIPNFLNGCYGNALTIFMLVPTITQAFGISALPSLT